MIGSARFGRRVVGLEGLVMGLEFTKLGLLWEVLTGGGMGTGGIGSGGT